MHTRWVGGLFALAAVAMMVVALWLWQFAPAAAMQYRATERSVFAMGGRCAAVAMAAAAQWLIVSSVIGSVYSTGRLEKFACRAAAVISGVSSISAVALGLAGK